MSRNIQNNETLHLQIKIKGERENALLWLNTMVMIDPDFPFYYRSTGQNYIVVCKKCKGIEWVNPKFGCLTSKGTTAMFEFNQMSGLARKFGVKLKVVKCNWGCRGEVDWYDMDDFVSNKVVENELKRGSNNVNQPPQQQECQDTGTIFTVQ